MNAPACLASCQRPALGLALIVAASHAAFAQDIRWTPNAGGSWNAASNWFNADPPTGATGARDVYINFAPYTIAGFAGWSTNANATFAINRLFSGANLTVTGSLTINGPSQVGESGAPRTFTLAGTLTGPGAFTVFGDTVMNSGTISGAGALTFVGPLTLAGSGGKRIARPFTWVSPLTFTGTGSFQTDGVSLTNTGLIDFQTDAWWYDGNLTNAASGVIRKSGGTGESRLLVHWLQASRTFNNDGLVEVQSGDLAFPAGGTHAGTFATSGASRLRFTTGVTHNFNGATLSGARVNLTADTLNFNAGTSLGGMNLTQSGGTVNLATGGAVTLGGLTFTGGAINTANPLSFPGPFTMPAGTFDGAGSVSITGGGLTMSGGEFRGTGGLSVAGPITLAGSGGKRITRQFTWASPLTFTGSGWFTTDGVSLTNTGLIDFQADAWWYDGNLTNAPGGVIRKSGGTGEAALLVQWFQANRTFNNDGLVEVQSGDLAFPAGGTHAGTFATSGASRLRFTTGVTHNFNGATLSGARVNLTADTLNFNAGTSLGGMNLTQSGGTVNLATGGAVTLGGLTFTGGAISTANPLSFPGPFTMPAGTFDGAGSVSITGGGLTMSGGEFRGTGALSVAGPLTLVGGGGKRISRQFSWVSPLTFTGSGWFTTDGVSLTNTGLIDFQADAWWYDGNLTNAPGGVIRKSGGTGEAALLVQWFQASRTFDNNGLVEVQSGDLALPAGGTHAGTFATTGASRLRFTAGVTHNFNGATLTGARVNATAGTLNFNAGTSLGGMNLTQSGGTANLATGAAVTLGSLTFTGGTINTANPLSFPGPFTMSSGQIAGAGSVSITGGGLTMTGGEFSGTGALSVAGPIDLTGAHAKYINRNFTKGGAMTISGTGWLQTRDASHTSEHVIDFQSDTYWYDGSLTNAPAGEIRKSAGSGDAYLLNQWQQASRTFNNQGTVRSSSGRLNIDAGGTHTGSFQTSGSGVLRFAASGPIHQFNAGATMANARVEHSHGTLNFNAGSIIGGANLTLSGSAALNLSTGAPVTLGSLAMTGGTINTAGALNVPGPFTMGGGVITGAGDVNVTGGGLTLSAGDFTGAGALSVAGPIELTGSGSKRINRSFTKGGALTFSGGGWLQTLNVSHANEHTIDFQTDAQWYDGNLTNAPTGVIRKSGGTGTAWLQGNWQQPARTLNNLGLIEVASGGLHLLATLENYTLADRTLTGGEFRVGAGCVLRTTHQDVRRNLSRVELDGVGAVYQDSGGLDAFRNLSENLGGFAIRNGRDFARAGAFANSGDIVIGGGGSNFSATGNYGQTDGLTQVDGQLAAPAVLVSGGQLSGTGSITGPVTMTGGTFAPGAPSTAPRGTLNVAGPYTQSAGATFSVLVSGATPANYSNLVASGTVTLAGALSVEVTRGFAANAGDTFRIIQGLARVGTFATVPDPADWQVIYGADFVDIQALRPIGPPALIRGAVTLDGWLASPSAAPVTIELRQGGVPIDSRIVILDGSGAYEFITRLRGTYDVTAKGARWLRRKIAGQFLGDDGLTGMDFVLLGGDVNDDNVVGLDDFLLLAATYELPNTNPGYDARADLNGDEAVDTSDFLILASNYDQSGDD